MIPRTLAVYIGTQHGLGESFKLYNLLVGIPGHPKDSTVTEATVLAYLEALEDGRTKWERLNGLTYCRACRVWHFPDNAQCIQRQRQAVKDTFRGMGC